MPDDLARALGAGGKTVTIGGKECTCRPLSAKELCEIERECLAVRKREYLSTFSANRDFLPEDAYVSLITEEMRKCAKWDIEDLGYKQGVDPDRIILSEDLNRKIVEIFNVDTKPPTDPAEGEVFKLRLNQRLKRLTAGALDRGMLTEEEYRNLTGKDVAKIGIPYVNWWASGCFEGQITMVWVCFKDNGVSRDAIASEIGRNPEMLAAISAEIETLSTPDLKNG